jgi:hypothetical protein
VINTCVWDCNDLKNDLTNFTPKFLRILDGHTGIVFALCALGKAGEQKLVSGSEDKKIMVWDIDSGECLKVLEGHTFSVTSLCALDTPAGQKIVSGSSDKTVKVWNFDEGTLLNTLEGHTHSVNSVCLLSDGRIVSGSEDKTLKIWNSDNGELLHTTDTTRDPIKCVCVANIQGQEHIVSGGGGGMKSMQIIDVYNAGSYKLLKYFWGHDGDNKINSMIAFGPKENQHIITSSTDSTIRMWDLEAEKNEDSKILKIKFEIPNRSLIASPPGLYDENMFFCTDLRNIERINITDLEQFPAQDRSSFGRRTQNAFKSFGRFFSPSKSSAEVAPAPAAAPAPGLTLRGPQGGAEGGGFSRRRVPRRKNRKTRRKNKGISQNLIICNHISLHFCEMFRYASIFL